jgi:hypothetical protein
MVLGASAGLLRPILAAKIMAISKKIKCKEQLEKKAVEVIEAVKEWGRWFLEQVRHFDLFWQQK